MSQVQPAVFGQGRDRVRVRRDGSETEEDGRPWAGRFKDYAALAALAYGDRNAVPHPVGWTLADTLDDPASSLYLDVWDHSTGDGSPETAIVFRGTQETKDWWSNARWLTRFIPIGWDQYGVVRARIGELVTQARRRLPQGRIVAVGHSLGGGLAQQAAYAHPEIKFVVAFDPSPVTGFRSVPEPDRSNNAKGIETYRVYEKGEILAFFRGPLKTVLPLSAKDPLIIEVRFDLSKGLSVKEHSMGDLAKRMAELAGS